MITRKIVWPAMLLILLAAIPAIGFAGTEKASKYRYLPFTVQSAPFPIKESFYLLSKPKGLSKKDRVKINRYLDINQKRVFNDERITAEDKISNPLIYIALAQLKASPLKLALRWGLEEDDPMTLFADAVETLDREILKMKTIPLKDFQKKLEKPLVTAILTSGHSRVSWEEYLAADITARQKILYRTVIFSSNRDVNIASYSMYLLSVSYMLMFRQENNYKYGKENFEMLARIFDVIRELKSVYDPERPLLFFISKKIEMRF